MCLHSLNFKKHNRGELHEVYIPTMGNQVLLEPGHTTVDTVSATW